MSRISLIEREVALNSWLAKLDPRRSTRGTPGQWSSFASAARDIPTKTAFHLDDHCLARIELLQDCVTSGASVGLLAPLSAEDAQAYVDGVAAEMKLDARKLMLALEGAKHAGAMQLALCGKKNGRYRAEIEKLMVHTCCRRKGLGEMLMRRIGALASAHGRCLLVLDTRGDDSASMYRSMAISKPGASLVMHQAPMDHSMAPVTATSSHAEASLRSTGTAWHWPASKLARMALVTISHKRTYCKHIGGYRLPA